MIIRSVLMLALWLLAWGQLTVANVVSGVAVTAALLLVFPPGRRSHSVHLRAAGVLRLVAYVVAQLVKANVRMAGHILRGRAPGLPGVLAHRLRRPSEDVVTLMTSIIALSPGTMTVDADEESVTVYVHFFNLDDLGKARSDLAHLEELCFNAIAAGPGVAVPEPKENA